VDITRRELISTIAKTGVPLRLPSASVLRRCTQRRRISRSQRPRSDCSTTPAFASVASLRVGLRRSQRYAADTRGDALHQGANDLQRSHPQHYQALQTGGWLACLFREAAVHALSRSRLRAGCPFQALHKIRDGHRELDRRGMHRLPLLHDHLSLPRAALSMQGYNRG